MTRIRALLLVGGIPVAGVLAILGYQSWSSQRLQSQIIPVPPSPPVSIPPQTHEEAAEETTHGEVKPEDIEIRIVCSGREDQTLREPSYLVQFANHSSRFVIAPYSPGLLKKGSTWFELTDSQGRSTRVEVESPTLSNSGSPYSSPLIPPKASFVLLFGSQDLQNRIFLPEIRTIRFVYAAAEDDDYQQLVKRTHRGDLLPASRIYSQIYQLALLK